MIIRGIIYCLRITTIQYLSLKRTEIYRLTAKIVSVCAVSHCIFHLRKASQLTKTQVSLALTCSLTFAVVSTKISGNWVLKVALHLTALGQDKKFRKLALVDTTGENSRNPRIKCLRFSKSCVNSMSYFGI